MSQMHLNLENSGKSNEILYFNKTPIYSYSDRKISWQNDFHVTLYFFKITEHVEREI